MRRFACTLTDPGVFPSSRANPCRGPRLPHGQASRVWRLRSPSRRREARPSRPWQAAHFLGRSGPECWGLMACVLTATTAASRSRARCAYPRLPVIHLGPQGHPPSGPGRRAGQGCIRRLSPRSMALDAAADPQEAMRGFLWERTLHSRARGACTVETPALHQRAPHESPRR